MKTPKGYLATVLVYGIIIFIVNFGLIGATTVNARNLLILFAVIALIYSVFNLIALIYFLAKKYEKISIVLPLIYITNAILFLVLALIIGSKVHSFFTIERLFVNLFAVIFSLTLLWRERIK